MLQSLVGQMSKFITSMNQGQLKPNSKVPTKRPESPSSVSSSEEDTVSPENPKEVTAGEILQIKVKETPKETDDSFQSCDDEETKGNGESTPNDIIKPDEVPEKWEPVCQYEKKDHYSNFEICTGRNPGWKSEIVTTSSGWKHDTNLKWQPLKYYGEPRYDMPFHRKPNSQSVLTLLKNMIGKDLTKFQFPVSFSEPLSMTQRCTELGKHSNILETASKFPDSLERCAWVASFMIAFFGDFIYRCNKNANPLLGETFEFACTKWRV